MLDIYSTLWNIIPAPCPLVSLVSSNNWSCSRCFVSVLTLTAPRFAGRSRHARTGRLSISAVYTTLERLEQKGLVRSRIGEPTAERGGRRRKHFELLPLGARTLKVAYEAFSSMTEGLEQRLKALR